MDLCNVFVYLSILFLASFTLTTEKILRRQIAAALLVNGRLTPTGEVFHAELSLGFSSFL